MESPDELRTRSECIERKKVAKEVVDGRVRALDMSSVSPDTIIRVLQYAIEAVSIAKVQGAMRNEMIVELVREAIVDAPIHDDHEALLLQMLDLGIVTHIVELVVAAAEGRVDTGAALGVAGNCYMTLSETYCAGLTKCLTPKCCKE